MIEHSFTAPAACGGLPLPPLRGPPTPECGGGQVYGGKRNRVTTSLAHPCFRGGWRAQRAGRGQLPAAADIKCAAQL